MNTPIDRPVSPDPLPGVNQPRRTWQTISSVVLVLLAAVGLYLTSLYSYLLFHSLAEMVSIAISLAIFLLVWNARSYLENHYLLFLGIGMLFVVIVTIVHTLAYKGMGVFIGFDSNLPVSLWIISRYMLALTFLFALGFVVRKLQPAWIFLGYTVITVILLLSVFVWPVFPVCYVEGSGLTSFKVISEYVISALFLVSLAGLWRVRKAFPSTTVQLLAGALLVSVLSELAFTFYVGMYDIFNLLGHLLLVFSCVLIYQAVVVTGMRAPYALIYRNLTQSEERYRSLFDNMLEGVSYCRLVMENGQARDWIYLTVNQAFEHLTGLVNVAGKRASDAIHGIQEADQELLRIYSRVALGGTPERFEMFVQSLGMWFSISVYSPKREYFVALFDVITEHKRAEEALQESEEKHRAVVERANDGIVILQDDILRFSNPNFAALIGYETGDVEGMEFSRFIPEENLALMQERAQKRIAGEELSRVFETALLHKSGKIISVEVNEGLIQYEGRPADLVIMRDIRERKQIEGEMEKTRADFLFGVSHELKTPLFLMNISLEMLENSPESGRAKRTTEFMETWKRNLHRLQHLVFNMVDSQRTQTMGFKLERQPTDFRALVERVVAEQGLFAGPKKVRITVDLAPMPPLWIDPDAIHRLVENLLTNAIKFSPRNGEITLRLAKEDAQAVLTVKDRGPGIPAEEQKDLFLPFQRAATAVRSVIPGTGLGLYVAKIIVDAHGGTISMRSKAGQGTTITVQLPLGMPQDPK